MENRIEYRSEFQLDEITRKISGYAAVFEKESNFLGFYETIKRGAISDEILKNSDIILNFQHNDDNIIARSKYGTGTLYLEVREDGLYFECEIPNTTLGNDIYESIKRGDLDECSFAFVIDPEDSEAQRWEKRDGILYREIYKIAELFDCAVVARGAYSDTSVSARKLDLEAAKQEIEKREKEEKKEKIDAELNSKISNILGKI